jgi:tetraacyldisaccharide 4'-kinase
MASGLRGVGARSARVALDRPVLSVGGLGLGGSGKTPFVRWLGHELARAGLAVAVLARGYGWVRACDPPMALVPGRGPGAGAAIPDEARLFLRDGFAVGAHPCRAAAAAALARAGASPDVYLLDDGFQHRRLGRDWDLVLLSARELSAPRRPLPAGPFRERWDAIARADRIAVTGLDAGSARAMAASHHDLGFPSGAPHALAGLAWDGAVELGEWQAGREPTEAVGPDREGGLGGSLVAFSGIADPPAFERLLARRGLAVAAHVVFPDHHRYRPSELERLLALRPRGGALITTEKDAARLPSGWALRGACWVARVELRIWRGADVLRGDLSRLARERA